MASLMEVCRPDGSEGVQRSPDVANNRLTLAPASETSSRKSYPVEDQSSAMNHEIRSSPKQDHDQMTGL